MTRNVLSPVSRWLSEVSNSPVVVLVERTEKIAHGHRTGQESITLIPHETLSERSGIVAESCDRHRPAEAVRVALRVAEQALQKGETVSIVLASPLSQPHNITVQQLGEANLDDIPN